MFSIQTHTSCFYREMTTPYSYTDLTNKEKERFLLLQAIFSRSLYDAPLQIEQGIRIIRENYSDSFLNECNLCIDDEVSFYNEQRAYDHIDFKSWFAIRDYKEGGYLHINRFLRKLPDPTTSLESKEILNRSEKLLQAINSLSVVQEAKESNGSFPGSVSFRAETCYREDIQHMSLEKETIFERPTFISTSEEKEGTLDFCLYEENLEKDQINIYYTIFRTSLLLGANISALVNDREAEVLFPPKTKFIIQDVKKNEKSIHLKLITKDINRSVWLENFWRNWF